MMWEIFKIIISLIFLIILISFLLAMMLSIFWVDLFHELLREIFDREE